MSYRVKDILGLEVAPALGCTEPSAIALGAAAAASLLGTDAYEAIGIWVDPNIYKNGLAVSIPGAAGHTGLDLASALGAVGGDPKLGLEVLETVDEEAVRRARRMVDDGRVEVNILSDRRGLYVRTAIKAGGETAESVIEDLHDNIVGLTLNGRELTDHPLLSNRKANDGSVRDLEAWLTTLSLDQLLDFIKELDEDDFNFLRRGVEFNLKLADYGLTHGPGLGIGLALQRLVEKGLLQRDMVLAARILTSAAADARMAGVKLPAMSSAGSGNHGLTAILPIWAIQDFIEGGGEWAALRAIALSHILTAYVKAHTGRLSAVCGCSVAAGAGAAGGACLLMGGGLTEIAGAIKNLISDLAGMICDGAKAGCAFKLATAAGAAVQHALFALHGVKVQPTDGIVGVSPEQTMKNVGALSTEGMIETDRTIIQIMLEKQFSGV